jgi:hypothetical protein
MGERVLQCGKTRPDRFLQKNIDNIFEPRITGPEIRKTEGTA